MLFMEESKCRKIFDFPNILIGIKNLKTFSEAQTASRLKENFQHPTRQKLPTSLEQKVSYGDSQEYTDICFSNVPRMQFLGILEMGHCKCFFLTSTRNMFAGKFVKYGFWLCSGRIFLIMLSELRLEVFWAKFYCKMSDL